MFIQSVALKAFGVPDCMFLLHAEFRKEMPYKLKAAQICQSSNIIATGKSFSEALILASTNLQYNKRLFIELGVQYLKITSSEHVVYITSVTQKS